ncbi:MAG: hypothetical protein H6814_08485 [Phycisphaeraceae bacterium]|nr:hypothetical protein [Phycisphaeraceae bacterium]
MLKAFFLAISTLAIAHILALVGFTAWLYQGDRLNMARIDAIRDIFRQTITAENAQVAKEAKAVEDQQAAADAAALEANPPAPVETRMGLIGELDDLNLVAVERLRKESGDLSDTLARQLADIDAAAKALEEEKAEFLRLREEIRRTEGSAQFKKALQRYEGLKPAEAQAVFQTLIDQGQTDQVVSYLNAMQPRTSAKIIGRFPPEVAADLLERIRQRGVETGSAPVASADANQP